MKVLVVHNRYRAAAPSGENRVVDTEVLALRRLGHEVTRFERRSDDIESWPVVRRAALPATVVWSQQARRDLTEVLAAQMPDVVHVHNTFPLLSPSVLHSCHAAGVPVVATIHNYKLLCASGDFFRDGRPCHSCSQTGVLAAVARGCYRGSALATIPVAVSTAAHRRSWRSLVSAYIFLTAAQRRLMNPLALDPRRVFVKHNLVPPPAGAGTPGHERDDVVAYVGRLDAAKGIPLLMQAWDEFRRRTPRSHLRLVIAGRGPLDEEVAQWAARHTSVTVAGLLPPENCTDLISRSRAVVVPSTWEETFGLVVLEAMAVGTPTIAPGHGSFPELVTAGVDGSLFPPGDHAALAEVLGELDRHPDVYAEYGRRAYRTYLQRHDPEDNVRQLLSVYHFARQHPVSAASVPSP